MKRDNMKIISALKSVILEQANRYDILKQKYTTPKQKGDGTEIPPRLRPEQFDSIVLADPTTRKTEGGQIKKAGKYVNWLLRQFVTLEPDAEFGTPEYDSKLKREQELFFEDLNKYGVWLLLFDKNKHKVGEKDINKYDINQLKQAVQGFSLTKATTTKQERKAGDVHVGAKEIYSGSKWWILMVDGTDEVAHEAACLYGGYGSGQGETEWCTAAPGALSTFQSYTNQGPVYIFINKNSEAGPKTGLPIERYQFHFPTNQYMDRQDSPINLKEFLINLPEDALNAFKPHIENRYLNEKSDSGSIQINGNDNNISYIYILLFGFDKFFESIPSNIKNFGIEASPSDNLEIRIPDSITRFNELIGINFKNCLSEVSPKISEVRTLKFFAIPSNPKLKTLPDTMLNMDNLIIINIEGTNNLNLSDKMKDFISSKNPAKIKIT